MKSDEELMILYKNGDLEAFESLYYRHKAKVMGYLSSRLQNRQQAEELFQVVFSKLHEKRALFNEVYPFLPWFYTLIRNTLIDHFRKTGVQMIEFEEHHITIDHNNHQREEINHLTQNLSLDDKELLYLKFIQGFSYDELERDLSQTSSSLRKKVSRILKKIKLQSAEEK